MGCIYSNFFDECTKKDEDDDSTYETENVGWDAEGHCVCEDDPEPVYSCMYYEEDNNGEH